MKWLFEINRIKKKNKMEGGKMKSGFIAIVGRPNVGKSTLMNKLVKEKVAIVSDKAGTTRDQIRGIVNIQDNQYIFVDTPGIHKPKHLLGEHMTEVALETLNDVDLIMFMLDGSVEISTGDIFVSEHVKEANTPVIVIINKIDKLSDEEIEEKKLEIKEKLGNYENIITLTAEYAIGIHKIFEAAEPYLSNDIWFYPEDYYTDLPVNKIVVETIREKILHHTKDEIPHSVAVEIINVETKPNIRKYDVNIYVERDSQKGIIIGKDGALLKKIGIEARREIEALIDLKVNLKLWVKVKKKWRKNKQFLDEMGYKIKKK
jgi:GTP-binding protein era